MATNNSKAFIVFKDENDEEFLEEKGKSAESVLARMKPDILGELEDDDIDNTIVEIYQLVKRVKLSRKVVVETKNLALGPHY